MRFSKILSLTLLGLLGLPALATPSFTMKQYIPGMQVPTEATSPPAPSGNPYDLLAYDSNLNFTTSGSTYLFGNQNLSGQANALPSAGSAFTAGPMARQGCTGDFTLTFTISGLFWQMGFMGVTLLDANGLPLFPNIAGNYVTLTTKYAGLVGTNFFKPAGEAHYRYLQGQTSSYNWNSLGAVNVSVTRTGNAVTAWIGSGPYIATGNVSGISGYARPALYFRDSGAIGTVTIQNWNFQCAAWG